MTQALDIDRIYRNHGHLVLRRARSILGNDAEAQEVLQEVFLSLMKHPSQYQGRSSLTTFLYSMTTHNCLNRIRNHKKRGDLLAERYVEVSETAPDGGQRLIAQQFLARLPKKLATVAVHYYVDEMTHEEIAEILGCSRRMVGKWIKKLHQEVRTQEMAA
jgi:RNA polymerase sigma-70 factor (ECF subfamily)